MTCTVAGNRKSEWSVVWIILVNQYIVKWLHDAGIEALARARKLCLRLRHNTAVIDGMLQLA